MNVLIPLVVGFAFFVIATRTYPFFLMKSLGVDDSRPTPATRLEDGRDYVPTRSHVVFAHHFAVIAGAGPIVGPVMALAFGWGPTWLWIVFGCILFGAVHDMTAMYVSVREDGRSLADMSRRSLGAWGYVLLLAFLVMILTLINAIFLNLSCAALTSDYPLSLLKLDADTGLLRTYPKVMSNTETIMVGRIGGIATTSVFVITLFAPIMGWLIHKKRWPMPVMYLIAAVACVVSVLLGFRLPIFLNGDQWRYVMSAYVFLACWIPVWLILQPRDFVNVQILYGGLIAMLVGVVVLGLSGESVSADFMSHEQGTRLAGPIWPLLMITVACGAISGFHSLAATGTTVKQITRESDVRRVGYNAMILEGCLALLAMLLVATALPSKEYFNIVFPATGAGNPILAFSMAMGYMLHSAFTIPIAVGAVLGILVVEGFVVTTLDTAVRLCRYMLEEFWNFVFKGKAPRVLRSPVSNTALAVGLMLYFALNSTIMSAWKIFGAGNQLIGALALIVATVWLIQRGRSFWFAVVPAILMSITTFAMLGLFIYYNLATGVTGPLVVSAKEKGPLVFASVVMLLLAIGVVIVSIRKFIQAFSARGAVAVAAAEAPPA